MLDGERDRLAVDVLDCRHGVGNRLRAHAQGNRERHGRSMWAASYSLLSVLSRITAQPAVFTTSTFSPCLE